MKLLPFAIITCLFFGPGISAQETIAFADFSHFPDGKVISNCFNFEAKGCDRNPHYGGKMRFLGEGATMQADFFVLSGYYNKVKIRLKHLSARSDNARYGGYAPVTLKANDRVIFTEKSPRNHTPEWETFDITEAVKSGKNELAIAANEIQTHYWLERFEVVLYPPENPNNDE